VISITWRSWRGGGGLEDLVPVLLDRNILIRYHEIKLAGPLQKQLRVTHLEHSPVSAIRTKTDRRKIVRRGRSGPLSEPYNLGRRLGYPSASAVRGLSNLHPER
jgi:hypothetical protein